MHSLKFRWETSLFNLLAALLFLWRHMFPSEWTEVRLSLTTFIENLEHPGSLADVARWGSHFVGLCFVAAVLGLEVFQRTSPGIVA